MSRMLKEALILFLITLIAGVALGGVYALTKKPIADQEAKAKAEAYRAVLGSADSFEEAKEYDFAEAEEFLKETGYKADDIDAFAYGYDASGNVIGYVITVTTHNGFGGDITFTMGIADNMLNAISILSISETAGLGMKASSVLVPQFAEKDANTVFSVVKNGATYSSEIDAISGATITSKALTDAVNAGLAYYHYKVLGVSAQEMMGGAANE